MGLRGQDAFDGVEGIGAEADGPLQGGEQVLAGVGAQQRQHLAGLVLAVALVAGAGRRGSAALWPEFGEAFAQQRLVLAWDRRWADAPVCSRTLAGHAAGQQPMAGDLLDLRAVDDQSRSR